MQLAGLVDVVKQVNLLIDSNLFRDTDVLVQLPGNPRFLFLRSNRLNDLSKRNLERLGVFYELVDDFLRRFGLLEQFNDRLLERLLMLLHSL